MRIAVLTGIFLFLIILIGWGRGAKAISGIILNLMVVIPSITLMALGFNIFVIMFLSSMAFILLVLFYQNGVNAKTVSSLVAVLCVVGVVSVIIYITCISTHITGMNEIQIDEGNNFMNYSVNISMIKILIVSMVWGELGAVTDTSISISSAMNELYENNKNLGNKELFKKGISVGNDILGTTINTLTFVAFGEALMLFLFYAYNHYTYLEMINSKSFFQVLSCVIFSCIGCVAVIPVTAVFFILILKTRKSHLLQKD